MQGYSQENVIFVNVIIDPRSKSNTLGLCHPVQHPNSPYSIIILNMVYVQKIHEHIIYAYKYIHIHNRSINRGEGQGYTCHNINRNTI